MRFALLALLFSTVVFAKPGTSTLQFVGKACLYAVTNPVRFLQDITMPNGGAAGEGGGWAACGIFNEVNGDFVRAVGRLIISPRYKTVFLGNKFRLDIREWDGDLKSPSLPAAELGQMLSDFAHYWETFGFPNPEVRVIVANNALKAKSSSGPFASPLEDIIVAVGITGKENVLLNRQMYRHELAHIFLKHLLGKESFITKLRVLDEALVDFMTANESGNPEILGSEWGQHKRNISDPVGDMTLAIHAQWVHEFSRIFSNYLWQKRAIHGPEMMATLMKGFILNLKDANIEHHFAGQYTTSNVAEIYKVFTKAFEKTVADFDKIFGYIRRHAS